MSKQAEKLLDEILTEEEQIPWDAAVQQVMDACDVKSNTAETYIRRAATAAHEITPKGEKVVVSPGSGETVLSDEDKLTMPAGGTTSQKFSELTVLEDVGHPLVPQGHDTGYYRRKIAGTKTDVQVVTSTMEDPDYSTLLIGEAGVGKDRLILHICANTNRPVIRPTFTGDADLVDLLIGTYAPAEGGGFEFKKGLLTIAVEYGYVFVADEINMVGGRLQTQMNDILEDASQAQLTIPETNEVIEPHPEFKFVGTMNPPTVGYSGTEQLNQAFKSRFFPVSLPTLGPDAERKVVADNTHWSADAAELQTLVSDQGGLVQGVRSLYESGQITTWISTRDIIKVGRMAEKLGDTKTAAEMVLVGMASVEDKEPIRSAIGDQNWPDSN